LIRHPGSAFDRKLWTEALKIIKPAPFFESADRVSALRQFRCFTGFLAMCRHISGASGIQLGSYADWLIRTYFCYAF
jgi:hypothetical protein